MKWIVIILSVVDPGPLPIGYPLECREFDTKEDAYKAYPAADVYLTQDQYNEFHNSFIINYEL